MSFAALLMMGCADNRIPSDFEQLSPSGPCWETKLSDGVNSVEEMNSLFSCINRSGDFDAYSPIGNTLYTEGRDQRPLNESLLDVVQYLGDSFGFSWLNDDMIDWVVHDVHQMSDALDVVPEFIYSKPIGQITPLDQTIGVVHHGLDLLKFTAEYQLNQDIWTSVPTDHDMEFRFLSLGLSLMEEHPNFYRDTLNGVSYLLNETNTPNNNSWSGARSNSLRQLTTAFFAETDNDSYMNAIRSPLTVLLDDSRFIDEFAAAIEVDSSNGILIKATKAIAYLASVDIDGNPISPDETSALAAIIRLLNHANAPLTCNLDLFGIPLTSFDIGNLSQEILSFYATRSPDTVTSVTGFVDILDWGISEVVLDAIVLYGACPLLTEQLVNDVQSLERLSDSQSWEIVVLVMNILNAAHHEDEAKNRIPEVVELVVNLETYQLTKPLMELIRDKPFEEIMPPVAIAVSGLFEPRLSSMASVPHQFDSITADLRSWLDVSNGSFDRDLNWYKTLFDHDSTWMTIDQMRLLLAQDEMRIFDLSESLLSLSSNEQVRLFLSDLYKISLEKTPRKAAYKIVENALFVQSIKGNQDGKGPLSFTADLFIDDIVQDLLNRMKTTFRLLSSMTQQDD